jgi:hypothetical protein
MSISSLSKLTVPLASDASASSQGLLMPKLGYRFRVMLENFGVSTPTTELTKQVIDATRPKTQFNDIPVHVYNSIIHLAGKNEWQDVTITIRDDATGQVQKLVGEQMQKQFDYYEQASAAAGQDYKFTTRIEILDGGNGAYTPTVLETWELYGCYVSVADYGSLAYDMNEALKISLTLKYDNAIQSPLGTGIGTAVGRALGTLSTGGG